MRLHRFYLSQPLGEEIVIGSVSTIKQMYNVFRYKEGDLVTLFNGEGSDVTYKIKSISSSVCELLKVDDKSSVLIDKKINLYISVIKKDNVELVAQKATELGVSKIIPIISERSEKKGLNKERLEKIVVEASEQCGRGDIPFINDIKSFDEAISSQKENSLSVFAQMNGLKISEKTFQDKLILAKEKNSEINIWIGPEGGWSEKEIEKFEQVNVVGVSLGQTVLRAETAAIVAVALML